MNELRYVALALYEERNGRPPAAGENIRSYEREASAALCAMDRYRRSPASRATREKPDEQD